MKNLSSAPRQLVQGPLKVGKICPGLHDLPWIELVIVAPAQLLDLSLGDAPPRLLAVIGRDVEGDAIEVGMGTAHRDRHVAHAHVGVVQQLGGVIS